MYSVRHSCACRKKTVAVAEQIKDIQIVSLFILAKLFNYSVEGKYVIAVKTAAALGTRLRNRSQGKYVHNRVWLSFSHERDYITHGGIERLARGLR